jgi:DNA-binding transcriptional MerR regulator
VSTTKSALTYTITELSREFDITPRAIRFYEDQGLLSPNREGPGGRNRVYTARERTHLKLTLRGKRLGLSLSDIKSLVDMYSSPKDTEPQLKLFISVLAQHRAALEMQREDIEVLLGEIDVHEKECQRILKNGIKAEPVKTSTKKAPVKSATAKNAVKK